MSTEAKNLRLAVARLQLLIEVPHDKRNMTWAHDICIASMMIHVGVWRLCPEHRYLQETAAPAPKRAKKEQLDFLNRQDFGLKR